MRQRGRAFTLLEVVVVLAVLGLALGIVVPRLGDREALVLDATARRLADTLVYLRERAILGIASCLLQMYFLPLITWLNLAIWMVLGFAIYFGYSRRHSLLSR